MAKYPNTPPPPNTPELPLPPYPHPTPPIPQYPYPLIPTPPPLYGRAGGRSQPAVGSAGQILKISGTLKSKTARTPTAELFGEKQVLWTGCESIQKYPHVKENSFCAI